MGGLVDDDDDDDVDDDEAMLDKWLWQGFLYMPAWLYRLILIANYFNRTKGHLVLVAEGERELEKTNSVSVKRRSGKSDKTGENLRKVKCIDLWDF